jgi:hypothetical protein
MYVRRLQRAFMYISTLYVYIHCFILSKGREGVYIAAAAESSKVYSAVKPRYTMNQYGGLYAGLWETGPKLSTGKIIVCVMLRKIIL